MIIFAIFGILFITIGITLYTMSGDTIDIQLEYDNLCGTPIHPPFANDTNPNECFMDITIEEDLDGPVFIYYQLENFYQNHRRYSKSRSTEQLLGQKLAGDV